MYTFIYVYLLIGRSTRHVPSPGTCSLVQTHWTCFWVFGRPKRSAALRYSAHRAKCYWRRIGCVRESKNMFQVFEPGNMIRAFEHVQGWSHFKTLASKWIYLFMYISTYISNYIYLNIHIYACTYIWIYMHTFIFIFTDWNEHPTSSIT